ncbi:MAG TPA: hypothetical protein IAB28_08005 [Candidatus Copromonas faecavium]|uniref:Uncharacterized protein n=1 Tax=Candidatus Copromonas faecavium (nom. illeg.) TaxID=2840740 RepID=A0A9D1D6R9_9FIRM|nr:hypothetical protein [Candidatus Copromonas faecavium]
MVNGKDAENKQNKERLNVQAAGSMLLPAALWYMELFLKICMRLFHKKRKKYAEGTGSRSGNLVQ